MKTPGVAPAPTSHGAWTAAKAAAPELRALRLYKNTWARLAVDQQLARSLAQVPDNPGPLNSQLLVLAFIAPDARHRRRPTCTTS